jgi:glucuronate isomerase
VVAATFLGEDFLLSSETAAALYHGVAERAPIVDAHTHLAAADVADGRTYGTLADYKWRAMRAAGVDEDLVTGDADPWDRFSAWASTVPRLVGNPLYVWSHLELRRAFRIDLVLSPSTAREIWDEANRQLAAWPVPAMLARFGVEAVATTDDPADELAAHRRLQGTGGVAVVPTFRPDAAHRLLDDPAAWHAWADRLAAVSGVAVDDLAGLLAACERSYGRFAELGGRASDHALARLPDRPRDPGLADVAVRKARRGAAVSGPERDAVALEVVALCARLAADADGVVQLHLGARRDVSPRLLARVGRDAGGDVVGDWHQGAGLARFLGGLEREGALPRTVLYNMNPADDAVFSSTAGAFARAGVPSLVQWGPPWWFNDHEAGVRRQLRALARTGQLAGFVGMVADSRSFLSFTRHELFRRVLCDEIGRDVARGRVPGDLDRLSAVVQAVCVDNARAYYGMAGAGGRADVG